MVILESPENRKLRGGYYTPTDLANAISKWALHKKHSTILEPSFGNGSFLKSIFEIKKQLGERSQDLLNSVYGVEINLHEYGVAIDSLKINSKESNLYCSDFFEWVFKQNGLFQSSVSFDAVVGNPPFIRYQNFPESSRAIAISLCKEHGVHFNRLTNMWAPFVLLSSELLKTDGRLGMVIPAELLQVSYAGSLRKYLIENFSKITVYLCNELFFPTAQQEVVILLAEGKKLDKQPVGRIRIVQTKSKNDLITAITNKKNSNRYCKSIPSEEKWLKYLLSPQEVDTIEELHNNPNIKYFGDFFSVDVGIVTGNNSFFVINKDIATEYSLDEFIRPVIGRSTQLKNSTLEYQDWKEQWDNGKFVGLLDLNNIDSDSIPDNLKTYLMKGITLKVNKGYKCTIRKDWYKIPSIWAPDAFMFRQIHDFPHLVFNNANAVSTDTIHRVTCREKCNFSLPLFYTYLTALSAEIRGRSYGGGVLELEPSEAEKLLIPNPQLFDLQLNISSSLREDYTSYLKHNSMFVLHDILGLSTKQVSILNTAYQKLCNRRKSRK